MRKTTLILSLFYCFNLATAQTGDEITDAIVCLDATPITASHVADATTASTTSAPECVSGGIDAFYFNTISASDNKITIGMSTDYGIVTTIHYQILRAPAGNIAMLQEKTCGSFDLIVGVAGVTSGGGFSEEIIIDVNSGDVYYLRVYKPDGLTDPILDALFDATTVSMTSENDVTLSFEEFNTQNIKFVNSQSQIEILNNSEYNVYQIYNVSGQLIANKKLNQSNSQIDISKLNNGMYILKLNSNDNYKTIKFIKQ